MKEQGNPIPIYLVVSYKIQQLLGTTQNRNISKLQEQYTRQPPDLKKRHRKIV